MAQKPADSDPADDAFERGVARPLLRVVRRAAEEPPATPPILDVWSRTQPRYRIRAALLLALNFVLFSGLCVFTHWLHTARFFDFSLDSYLRPFRFWGAESRSLIEFVLYPINVQDTPIHAVVLGLLLGAIVAVPILTAMLYRFSASLPFVAAVFALAHMPWMAATLLLSCVLASVPPFRMSFRFGSALLALLPLLAYFFLATRGATEHAALSASPTHYSLLLAPWVLALLAASAMMATVLLISRAVNYRPGVVGPVLAVMFAAPVVLFHARVGSDELRYRVLEAGCGPRSQRFESVRDAGNEIRELLQGADDALFDRYLPELWGGQVHGVKRLLWERMQVRFLADRSEAYEATRQFLNDYPVSRFRPNALYIQARLLDTRLDARRLTQDRPRRELYAEFPHGQSEPAWLELYRDYPDSPLSLAAGLRLAQLRLRRGEVESALACLHSVQERGRRHFAQAAASQPALAGFWRPAAPEATLEFEPQPYLAEAQRLAELIEFNRSDEAYGDAPLVELARLDPRLQLYMPQLLALVQRFAGGLLVDDLLLLRAVALDAAAARSEALEAVIVRFPGGSAATEALVRLAELDLQPPGDGDPARRERALARLRDAAERSPESYWGQLAGARLATLALRRVQSERP